MKTPARLFVAAIAASLRLSAACPCLVHFGLCDEVKHADAVFIGTVESIAPKYLNPWARADFPAAEIARLQSESTPESLAKLKKLYRQLFEGLPEYSIARIDAAQTAHDLEAVYESLQSAGRYARFRVRTLYKLGDDDNKDDDDDRKPPAALDVWSGGGECGISFHPGETYLVYATQDEDSGRLETSICMRTTRLTDERGDLGYLHFLKNAPEESARLEGFVSSSYTDLNLPRYEDSITAPSKGATLELEAGDVRRYTQSDADGRFAFDGLQAGDYTLSLVATGFPPGPRVVEVARAFHADNGACVRQVLITPAKRTH